MEPHEEEGELEEQEEEEERTRENSVVHREEEREGSMTHSTLEKFEHLQSPISMEDSLRSPVKSPISNTSAGAHS